MAETGGGGGRYVGGGSIAACTYYMVRPFIMCGLMILSLFLTIDCLFSFTVDANNEII